MNIIVLAGGFSSERDVSLASGSKITKALKSKGHSVILLDSYANIKKFKNFKELYKFYGQDEYNFIISEKGPDLLKLKRDSGNEERLIGANILEACRLADIIFIGLHGSAGENGQIQAMLDLFNIKYTGSNYAGCLLSMNKAVAKEIMNFHGVKTPDGEEINLNNTDLRNILKAKKPPYIIKPCSGGSSLGVTIVKKSADINKALDYAKSYEDYILLEEFIKGREFTVGVLDGKALPAVEIIPKSSFFDYANKYQEGCTDEICPAPIDEETSEKLKKIALTCHKILRLGDYSRTDFMIDEKGEIYCLETNSLPGMTPGSLLPKEARAIGMSYEDLCEKIINLGLKREK